MEAPNIKSTLNDKKNAVTYHVLAYRKLSAEEILNAVRAFKRTKQGKKRAKKGSVITIMTIIGYND